MADTPTTPAITPAAPSSAGLVAPAPVPLTEIEKQQILASLGRPGWQVTSSAALPDIEVSQNLGKPALTTKGTYTITVIDPAHPQGGGDKITIRKGAPVEGGGTQWLAESPAPKSDAKVLAPSDAVHVAGRGYYLPDDPNNLQGSWSQVLGDNAPNADDELIKAVDRQTREAERNEREANDRAGKGYVNAKDLATIQSQAASAKLGQDQLAENIRQFGITQKSKDAEQKRLDDKAKAEIPGIEATTQQTVANTGLISTNTDVAKQTLAKSQALLPTDIEQAQVNVEATKQSNLTAAQQRQIAGAPTTGAAPAGMYSMTTDPKTGKVDYGFNAAYVPKTQAEVAARVGQIQTLAQQKQAEIQAKVDAGSGYTADQGLKEFNSWWDQNVEPHKQALQAAQEEVAFTRAKDQAEAQRAALATAQGAGTQAINAYEALVSNPAASPVGPNYEAVSQAIRSAAPGEAGKVNRAGAYTWEAPDVGKLAQDAVNNAMKQIDPRAALATGSAMPNYQQMDPNALLNRTNYMPAGAVAPGGGAPPPGVGGAAPANDQWLQEWQARQAADAQQQQLAQKIALGNASAPGQVPGQNYGAATAYSGGINPWDYQAQNYAPPF